MNEYDIEEAFAAIEEELIASMMRNLSRHKAEEDREGIQWEMWQAKQLEALNEYKRKNRKQFSKQFSYINSQMEELIRTANEDGQLDQEAEILKAIKSGFKGIKRNSNTMSAEFFELNDRKLDALIKATMNDMNKAETAILRMANDQYRKAIFNAQVYANTGAGTYKKAVDMAVRNLLSNGLGCVEYSNGSRHRLKDYADMAIRTASKRAYLQGEGTKRQEWGISTVIMNKRGNPCPKCLPFVGKVLVDDVWSGGRSDGVDPETGKKYPTMSYAISKGLYHPRCKDSHTTYFPGISTADDTWTKKELEDIGLQAKQEARQQYAKRQAEKFERLAKYSLDEDNRQEYKRKAKEWSLKDKIFSKLKPHHEEVQKKFMDNLENINNTDMKQLWENAMTRVNIKESSKRNSYYSHKQKTIFLAPSATESTLAHELFHEIDSSYEISQSGMLTKSIENDFRRLNNLSIGYGMNIADMLYSKHSEMFLIDSKGRMQVMESYRGISDILNGMSQGQIQLGYGHKKTYWNTAKRVEAETWAQYGRMMYEKHEDVYFLLNELFPETTKEIKHIVTEMIK